jgi:F-type H+-transporting ATPase subunit a
MVNLLEIIAQDKLPPVLVGTWLVMGILLVFAFLARRALLAANNRLLPDDGLSLRSLAEVIVEGLDKVTGEVLESHDYRALVPYFGSLFLFILVSNLTGLIPGMEPPTAYSDLTFALGAISFVYYLYHGLRARGVGYLRSFLGPMLVLSPLMLPLEIADNLFRPFSLGVRLYANMFADHQVLSIFTQLTKLVIPLAFYALGTLVCLIQAMVFTVLSMGYVKIAQSADH